MKVFKFISMMVYLILGTMFTLAARLIEKELSKLEMAVYFGFAVICFFKALSIKRDLVDMLTAERSSDLQERVSDIEHTKTQTNGKA